MKWIQLREKLMRNVGEHDFYSWFEDLEMESYSEGILVLRAENSLIAETLRSKFSHVISGVMGDYDPDFSGMQIKLKAKKVARQQSLYNTPSDTAPKPKKPLVVNQQENETLLLPHYTFETFIIGDSNQFACSASEAVANQPGEAYNPLFLFGGTGLGKTHLLHAIGNKAIQRSPGIRVCYTTGERFVKEMIKGIQNRNTNSFDKKYREQHDMLLVDDIHILSGKKGVQEEFFNIFNHLHNQKKQLVITSDRSPYDIEQLQDRLRSRFAWGLIADVKIPDYVTRVAILEKKAELWAIEIPEKVCEYIAEHFKKSVRELEGTLKQLNFWSQVQNKAIDYEMAVSYLERFIPKEEEKLSSDRIIVAVAKYYDLTAAALKGTARQKKIAEARHVAMYLIKKHQKDITLQEIGDIFSKRNHATVLNGLKKVEYEKQKNPLVVNSIQNIERKMRD